MTDLTLGFATAVCISGSVAIMIKLCSIRNEEECDNSTEYLLIRKDYYNDLKNNASIIEQPILPAYTEKSPLQYYPPKDSAAFSNPTQIQTQLQTQTQTPTQTPP